MRNYNPSTCHFDRNDKEHDHDPDNIQLRVHRAWAGPVRHPHLPDGKPHHIHSHRAVLRYSASLSN